VLNSWSIKEEGVADIPATLVEHSTDMSTPNDVISYLVTWAAGEDPIAGNKVVANYTGGGVGKYQDDSPLPDDPAVPMESKTLQLTNCLDPTNVKPQLNMSASLSQQTRLYLDTTQTLIAPLNRALAELNTTRF